MIVQVQFRGKTFYGETLTPGQYYDVRTLWFIGWTEGDGSGHEGYGLLQYFDRDGIYRGANSRGIEPLFWREP